MWRGLQPAASRLVLTPAQLEARNNVSRHECRDGSLERLRHKVNSAVGTWHDEKSRSDPFRDKGRGAIVPCFWRLQGTPMA